MERDARAISKVLNVFSDAIGIKVGQDIYVVYRASSRNAPHVKRVRVLQCQATIAADGKGEITFLCEDQYGVSYVYRYDQVMLDLNAAARYVAAQSLREEMGLDEFCRVISPNFKYKRKRDGDEARSSTLFDPSRTVDENERDELLRRVNETAVSGEYWKGISRK